MRLVCVYIPTWIHFKWLLRFHLRSLHSADLKHFFFAQLVDWMTDSCWVSSLTQQSRDCTAIDRCLALSLSMSGAESEWQMACRAEGPPPAGVNVSVCLFSSEQSKRDAFCFCPLLPFISVPGKVQWLWIMEPLHPGQTVFTFPAENVCHLNSSLCPLRSLYDLYRSLYPLLLLSKHCKAP